MMRISLAVSNRHTMHSLINLPHVESISYSPHILIELPTPSESEPDTDWALEPRLDSPSNMHIKPENVWPVDQEVKSIGNTVRLTNTTDEPIFPRRNEHICQIRSISDVTTNSGADTVPIYSTQASIKHKPYSSVVPIDTDNYLSRDLRDRFKALHLQFDDVFNPSLSKYNGTSGKIEAVVNMGPTLPPQRKGRAPTYNHENMSLPQQKFDELELA